MANASGAAGPAACATKVILKAAVTVGQMMDKDMPTASGRLKRDINWAMFLRFSVLAAASADRWR
jgi:hypothetical protein